MELTKENLSTIAVFIYITISPILTTIGWSIDQTTFTSAFIGIVGLALAIYSSKNPNTIKALGNDTTTDNDDIA